MTPGSQDGPGQKEMRLLKNWVVPEGLDQR